MLKKLFALLALSILAALPAHAEERITNFHSRIEVTQDARILVTETIDVIAENREINHGIYRDFPTVYKSDAGRLRAVSFKVLGVRCDGKDETFRVENISGGKRIYAGSADVIVSPGLHAYEFSYETSGLVGFFKDYDEIYWNVTGNGWRFPIDRVSAEIVLPEGAKVFQSHAYTGPEGSTAGDYGSEATDYGMFFYATRPLATGEGLTVAAGFNKGVLAEPSPLSRIRLLDFIGLLGIVATFLVYYHSWDGVGRDPEMGVVVPEYAPPKGLSAAASRYLVNMGWDDKIFAIGVVELAIKGWLTIIQEKFLFAKSYKFVGKKGEGMLDPAEKKLAEHIGVDGETFVVSQKHWRKVKAAQSVLERELDALVGKRLIHKNGKENVPGVAMAALSIAAIVAFGHTASVMGREVLLLFIPLVFVVFLLWMLVARPVIALLRGQSPSFRNGCLFLFLAIWSVGFFGGMFASFGGELSGAMDPLVILELLSLAAVAVMVPVFYRLMMAPTEEGQVLRRHLMGYKLYLEMAEKERLEFSHPPKMTPEIFEQGLPYAMALDVENKWAERFAQECRIMEETGRGYNPLWYSGAGAFAVADMVGNLSSSLPATLASSAHDPSSHSGSGGGGSSGGGGGGGGGGGW